MTRTEAEIIYEDAIHKSLMGFVGGIDEQIKLAAKNEKSYIDVSSECFTISSEFSYVNGSISEVMLFRLIEYYKSREFDCCKHFCKNGFSISWKPKG